MKKSSVIIAVLALAFAFGSQAHAQTVTQGTMPTFYDQNGTMVNNTNSALPAGYYYVNGSPAQGGHQIYYYGNGTYYDPSTQTYGGSIYNPNGTAGAALNYPTNTTVTPGVPNTGAGGAAAANWAILFVAGAALAGSAVYLARQSMRA